MLERIKSRLIRLKRAMRVTFAGDLAICVDQPSAVEFHGSRHAGWGILAGSVREDSIVYSFGIGEDASFDLSLISGYRCKICAFDPTPKSLVWAEKNIREPRFKLYPWAISGYDGILRLFLPRIAQHVSASLRQTSLTRADSFEAECYRLGTIMSRFGHARIDILKMDIEGAEYEVIDETIASGTIRCVDQLLIEFHHWIPEIGHKPTIDALARLRAEGFCVHWVSDGGREVLLRRKANP
jgi:FkbM family methyltransferase